MLRRSALGLATLTLLLAACVGPQIFHQQLSVLDKGMAPPDVQARLKLTPLSTHAASAAGRRFDFHRYRMNNGVQSDLYLLAYEGERLVFWGYVSEFRRQPDADMNRALDAVLRDVYAAKP